MKAGGKKLGASKKQPCTGCGDKGIDNYMKGKKDAKAAFLSLTPKGVPGRGVKGKKK